jgi:hypothetical protein
MKIHSMAAVFGLLLAPALAGAADEPAPAPVGPPAGTPAAEPAGPVPAPEPAPVAEGAPTEGAAAVSAPATPTDTGAAEAAPSDGAAPSTLINIDVEGASAYVWRGVNLFGATQDEQAFSVFPSITATFGAVSIGYWGAFQLSGDNKSDLVDTGVGGENDFILKYSGSISDDLAYSAMLTYWIYPFADEDAAGVATPMYIEPGAGITYATGADLGLYVGYYRALQGVNDPFSFLYINPSVGKTIPLTGDIGLAVGLSAGYKIYTDLPDGTDPDRALDLTLNVGATIPFSDMYITPQVHASYVTRDDGAVPDAEFKDQFIAWAGVHVGYNIGL